MNARRRHMTGERQGDYFSLAPDDVQTGDIPLDIPLDGEWNEMEESVTAVLQSTVQEVGTVLKERFRVEENSLVAEAYRVFHGCRSE